MNYLKELNKIEAGSVGKFLIQERRKEIFILDSSVIFKWFYSESENSIEAAKILYEKTIA